jgi:hypothetical protein
MSSIHDDQPGSERTYFFLKPGRGSSVVLGSSMMFIIVVNAALTGLLAATIVFLAGGAFAIALGIGGAIAITFAIAGFRIGYRAYRRIWEHHEPMVPTPATPDPMR